MYIIFPIIFLIFGKYVRSADDPDNNKSENRQEIYSSTFLMTKLFEKESQLVYGLEHFLQTLENNLLPIKRYISEHKASLSLHNSSATAMYHPVDAYALLRRHVIDFENVENFFKRASAFSEAYIEIVDDYRKTGLFPDKHDLHGGVMGIIRLHHMYQLSMEDLINGQIKSPLLRKEFHSNHKIPNSDLKTFVEQAEFRNYPSHIIEAWYQAEQKAEMEEDNKEDPLFEKETPFSESLTKSDPTSYLREKQPFKWAKADPKDVEEDHYNYLRLCGGEEIMKPSVAKHLRCYYHSPSLSFLIGPLKVEEKSRDPTLIEFHDFITEKEADDFVNITMRKKGLYKSGTGDYGGGVSNVKKVHTQYRTSQNTWNTDVDFPLASELSGRISETVSLIVNDGIVEKNSWRWNGTTSTAEPYQVLNYGIGGVYFVHPDYYIDPINPDHMVGWDSESGNRAATFMIYLSDVEAGGGTAFPRIGTYVSPRKGKAVFWWNLNRNGYEEKRSWHGGCPVLYGSKWITNKWIQIRGQMNTAPCGLHPEDIFTYPM